MPAWYHPRTAKRAPERVQRLQPVASSLGAFMDHTLRQLELEQPAEPGPSDTPPSGPPASESLAEQREDIYRMLVERLDVAPASVLAVRRIFESSDSMGQGNPQVTVHPMSRAECQKRRRESHPVMGDEAICGAKNMVALFAPDQRIDEASVCIDQFEFPNIPCEYPVAWVRTDEALALCRALGKRLCDAHEWEGACAGEVLPPAVAYDFDMPRMQSTYFRNLHREVLWATLVPPVAGTCATASSKSPGCVEPSWQACGTNSYPAGAFPGCVSSFGVYDLHGNLAEHMNFPLRVEELGSRGGSGETELKGSWFGFDLYEPHEGDCRWRAPAWHVTRVDSHSSHRNYHLGFRCCRDLD